MAVTGAIFNSLIYGDVNSADYGVYISGDAVFNAPQRSVELVSVPGRNGSIAIDQGHFENIEVEYPAGMFGDDKTDFRQRLSDFRNAIMSKKGYQRLSDTYHPDEYRMGMYIEGLEVEPTHYNEAGQFTLKFNCKPQRYLTSGEELVDMEDWTDVVTVTGDEGEPVQFDNDNPAKSFKSIEESFLVASQDGTPWKSEVESTPYLFRQSSGGSVDHDYNSESDTIVGGTVAWNQLVANSGSVSVTVPSGHKYYSNIGGTKAIAISNGSAISATGGTDTIVDLTALFGSSTIADYLYSLEQTTAGSGIAKLKEWGFDIDSYHAYNDGSLVSVKTSEHRTVGKNLLPITVASIKTLNISGTWSGNTYTNNNVTYEVKTNNDGSISEIVVNGTNNSGSTIDFTLANQNSFGSVTRKKLNTEALVLSGCPSGGDVSTYYIFGWQFSGAKASVRDLGNGVSFTGINAESNFNLNIGIKTGTTMNNKSFKPMLRFATTDAIYEPYESHSYPLDSDLELRGIPKLSNGSLYYDGDEYQSNGTVTRKYGIVDLGTLNYNYNSSNGAFYAQIVGKKNGQQNFICSKYVNAPSGSVADMPDKTAKGNDGNAYVNFKDASYNGDTATFKTAMSGIYLIYELSTPTTETADPFTAIQDVSPYGTEQYLDYGVSQGTRDIAVPVGHQARYIERVPIEGIDSITTYLGNTDSVEDATAYETNFNGTEYGGMLDVISGEFTRYFKGITYTGQNIGDTWISDCEPFVAGTLPTYGAQVVYLLSTFETDELDGHDIDTLVGHNVLWSDPTSATLEAQYGFEPGMLYNPTRFDAQPLLEVEGYGDIEFNGYDIHIANMQIGEVIVKNGETRTVLITTNSLTPEQELNEFTLNLDVGVLEVGDTINAPTFRIESIYKGHGIQQIDRFFEVDPPVGLNLIAASIIDATTVQFIAEIEGTSFVYGTAKETELASVEYGLNWTISPLHTAVQNQFIQFHLAYDGADKLTVHSVSTHADVTYFSTNKTVAFGNINAISTQDLSGHPTYINCDLGEAYKIERGSVVSLNKYIDLGSELPRLASGMNEIEYDNTVTDLKIKPNWWKV